MNTTNPTRTNQRVAILIDGNNIERSIIQVFQDDMSMVKFDTLVPRLLGPRELNRLVYFREGQNISHKLARLLHDLYYGSVQPCHKSADIPLTIKALQISEKVDTIIILSGDSDYVELVRHLKSCGVRVEIASVEETTAQILRDEADYFHPIVKDDCFGTGTLRAHDRGRNFGGVTAPSGPATDRAPQVAPVPPAAQLNGGRGSQPVQNNKQAVAAPQNGRGGRSTQSGGRRDASPSVAPRTADAPREPSKNRSRHRSKSSKS